MILLFSFQYEMNTLALVKKRREVGDGCPFSLRKLFLGKNLIHRKMFGKTWMVIFKILYIFVRWMPSYGRLSDEFPYAIDANPFINLFRAFSQKGNLYCKAWDPIITNGWHSLWNTSSSFVFVFFFNREETTTSKKRKLTMLY